MLHSEQNLTSRTLKLTFSVESISVATQLTLIVINDQQDATILAYLFTPNHLYMFWALYSPIIRST